MTTKISAMFVNHTFLAIIMLTIASSSLHGDEREMMVFVGSRNTKAEWTRATLVWGKLFYKNKELKKEPIDLTESQIEKIKKLCLNIEKVIKNPRARKLPAEGKKELISFSFTFPDTNRAFATLLLREDKNGWEEAIKLRDYLKEIASNAKQQ